MSATPENSSAGTASSDIPTPPPPANGEDEALEWSKVIELKAFSERKNWIEDKIKLLEQMPPVEVFVGMDAIKESAEVVPGLPTRQQLEQWLVEHDAIEKETEVFDKGELQTIRKFTKAATQRNLSPADTDLIELTLTTIYDLDKLLHLLRDRSENFELLNQRLRWEEFRSAAWVDRRTIISDLKTFLDIRAHWTPSVYEEATPTSPPPSTSNRRGSLTSLASSVASESSLSSNGFSRSARFKLAEVLSRDAAQFSARITSLRHNKIASAGKVLDKLIDSSRKPVPEEILDEQDRLEEKGISDLENVGKFVMSAVMQWRKADEIYVESMKDQVAAQALWDEIEAAKFQHPTARQSASFATRAEALLKRLVLRGDPASPSSAFPRPAHVLFPEYASANEDVVQTLSSEIATALELVRKAETSAKEYRLNYEAVHRVETLVETAAAASSTFTSIIERLEKGVSTTDGDGTPPNLMSDACLEPTRHAAFLALLPSIIKESETTTETAVQVLRNSRGALLSLDRPGIDPAFKSSAAAEFQKLSGLRGQAQWTRDDVVARVGRLREARRIWNIMEDNLSELEVIRRELGEAMERHRWQQDLNTNSFPPTPESFSAPLPSDNPPAESVKRLDELDGKLVQEVDAPLASLAKTLEAPLNERLLRGSSGLKQFLQQVRQMAGLLESVKNQATVMGVVRDDYHGLQTRLDELKARVDAGIQDVLASQLVDPQLKDFDLQLGTDIKVAHSDIKAFQNGLSQRVPLVSIGTRTRTTSFVKRRFSSTDLKLVAFDNSSTVELPFDLHNLDDAVRTDSNSYVMKLGGDLDVLDQQANHFRLAIKTKEVDMALAGVISNTNKAVSQLAALKNSLHTIQSQSDISQPLSDLSTRAEHVTSEYRITISRALSPIRELLKDMEASPGVNDPSVHESLYLARLHSLNDVELRFQGWLENMTALSTQIEEARRAEEQRLEAERLRLATEEAERARLERERLEKEEAERIREEQLAEQRRQEAERARIAVEEAEKALIAQQEAEEEERRKAELLRLEEERRLQAEQERLAAEEAERARLERERLDMEIKLKLAQEQLAEERRLQAEKELHDQQVREAAERERLEQEKRLQEERDRQAALEKEELERESRQRHEMEVKLKSIEEQLATERALNTELAAEVDREAKKKGKARAEPMDHDVFGLTLRAVSSNGTQFQSAEMNELQNRIFALRKRLRALSIEGFATSTSYLPSGDETSQVINSFLLLNDEISSLPQNAEDPSVEMELASLRAEVAKASQLVGHLQNLVKFMAELKACDAALSDLLEHVDTYPSPPLTSSSSFQNPVHLSAEDQLKARLEFTTSSIALVTAAFGAVQHDQRAIGEHDRIQQTWVELEEMAKDRIHGRRSRPPSVSSSGRNSSASLRKSPTKSSSYSALSVGSPTASSSQRTRSRLVPPQPANGSRRSTYGTERSRPPSQLSNVSSSRSTSGPIMHGTTFASRQRTTSLTRGKQEPPRRVSGTSHIHRTASPTTSEASSYSRSVLSPSRASSTSTSTWSRTPRYSLPSLPKNATPQRKAAPPPRKKYIPNPKSKLDVAVGEVVNKLPVGISIEGVSDSWKDQSGKYWIGDQDPKLCFCRILRSQTVMVRVGGGWQELSRFIQGHFADSFRLFEESPPRPGGAEPKWISSATLIEAAEHETPPQSPRTPEPQILPTFSLMTPSGHSPHSLKSSPSTKGGSPLTPLQFMRRAEPETLPLPTPSPSKSHARSRTISTTPAAANRTSIWRP
ncbi:Growth arrest-specific 2-like [Mycena indigotica]|uniref:Growth arrest-specific 2-like n=1 Tax=Mycena indigotica TaxID=2126181 RepID=A0A8H6SMF6_9AGAR|nr:Growth arrest-specific 2-like [Mycena indigotica]KAF7301507.1 Growth arrest-specific 2-like [Mycena indigotica]